ncbi:hypothetical protein [Arcticibacter eurypsychrophilus]|uniref:hypothetical protein n=1 Tax=Arcticibacter eurypsychrophilus TaxID=1434752 RepID=UPI00084DA59F|nr:hypothetical protein [Arcticibacter eurypsychrophilus]
MDLPASVFSSMIKERAMYYFSAKKLIITDVPHHFIVIKKLSGGVLILSCCTSKFDTIYKFISLKKFPEETMVTIPAYTEDTKLTKHTYVDCNKYFEYTIREFEILYKKGGIKCTGTLPEEYYEKIVYGMIVSPEIEEELKDELKKGI